MSTGQGLHTSFCLCHTHTHTHVYIHTTFNCCTHPGPPQPALSLVPPLLKRRKTPKILCPAGLESRPRVPMNRVPWARRERAPLTHDEEKQLRQPPSPPEAHSPSAHGCFQLLFLSHTICLVALSSQQ